MSNIKSMMLELKSYLRVATDQALMDTVEETDNSLILQVRFCTLTLIPPTQQYKNFRYCVDVWLGDDGSPDKCGVDITETKTFYIMAEAIVWLILKIIEYDVLNVIELESESGSMYSILNEVIV